MQPKAAHVFRVGGVGRAPEELCEVLDPLHIVMLGLLRELADCHVLDHAPTQRACCLFGHGDAPVLSEGCGTPSSQNRTPHRAILIVVPPPQAPYRASGLVQWPVAEMTVAGRCGRFLGSTRRRG